jgi:hypothetical protein
MAPTVKLSRGQLTVEDCNIRYVVSHLCLRVGFAFRARASRTRGHTRIYTQIYGCTHTGSQTRVLTQIHVHIRGCTHTYTHTGTHRGTHTHAYICLGLCWELTLENWCFQWGENRRDCTRGLPFGHPVRMCMHMRVSVPVVYVHACACVCVDVCACVLRACVRTSMHGRGRACGPAILISGVYACMCTRARAHTQAISVVPM